MKTILAKLLVRFKFEPADCAQDITWDMLTIAAPRVKTSKENKHQLPLKVSLLSEKECTL